MTDRQQAFFDYLSSNVDMMFLYRKRYALMVGELSEGYILTTLGLFIPSQYAEA